MSGTGTTGGTLAYSANREQVYLNGAQLQRDADYTANNGTSVVLNVALIAGDVVEIICVNNLNGSTSNQSQDQFFVQSGTGATTRTVESKLRDVVSVKDFGAVGDGVTDDTAAIQAAIDYCFDAFHQKLYFPAGRYRVTDTIRIDPTTQGLTDTAEAFTIYGDGSRNGVGTTIRFDFSDATKNGLELISSFSFNFQSLQIDGLGDKKNLVLVDALDTPGFAGHLVAFTDVQFRSFTATPAEAVVQIKNSKLISLERCYVGTQANGDTSILIGGNAATNGSKNLNGKATLCKLINNYIWGIVDIKYAGELEIKGNQFVEGSSGIRFSGDGNGNNVIIADNYFAEASLNVTPAIVLTAAAAASGLVGSGSIFITRNRFRHKQKAIIVDGGGPIFIQGNSWELCTGATCGVEIANTAERVYVGDNYWDNLTSASVPPVSDLRYTFATSEPTANVSKSIVTEAILTVDDTTISANNTNQLVLTTPAVSLSGGQYKVRCLVNVRCTDAAKSLPFQVIVRYAGPTPDVNLGLIASGWAPSTSDTYSATTTIGSVYLERVVNLPANTAGDAVFKVYVRNAGAATAATGWVEGTTTELTDSAATWIQVERLYS